MEILKYVIGVEFMFQTTVLFPLTYLSYTCMLVLPLAYSQMIVVLYGQEKLTDCIARGMLCSIWAVSFTALQEDTHTAWLSTLSRQLKLFVMAH